MNDLETWDAALTSLLHSIQDDSADGWEVEVVRTRVNDEIKQLQAERDRYKQYLENIAKEETGWVDSNGTAKEQGITDAEYVSQVIAKYAQQALQVDSNEKINP